MPRWIYCLIIPFVLIATDFKYEVSIAAIFNDEGRFLKEWIEFHKTVGVEHFYLYNNRSKDNFADVLRPYVEAGEVDLIDWPYRFNSFEEWNDVQCGAYEDAIKRAKKESRWLALIDIDEFVFATDSTPLPVFLEAYKEYGALVVNWQCYGTSNVVHIPNDKYMIEVLVKKGEANHKENRHIKSIVQPQKVAKCRNPHFCLYKKDYFAVSPSKKRVSSYNNDSIEISKIRINHYWSRDEDFVTEVKIPRQVVRWGADPNLTWDRVRAFNKVEDKAIFYWLGEMKRRLN